MWTWKEPFCKLFSKKASRSKRLGNGSARTPQRRLLVQAARFAADRARALCAAGRPLSRNPRAASGRVAHARADRRAAREKYVNSVVLAQEARAAPRTRPRRAHGGGPTSASRGFRCDPHEVRGPRRDGFQGLRIRTQPLSEMSLRSGDASSQEGKADPGRRGRRALQIVRIQPLSRGARVPSPRPCLQGVCAERSRRHAVAFQGPSGGPEVHATLRQLPRRGGGRRHGGTAHALIFRPMHYIPG